jgi:hypothetical protein
VPTVSGLDAMTVSDASSGSGPHTMRGRDWLLVAVTIAPLVALIVVALVKVGHGYFGTGDNGLNELRVSDVGSHWPLVGPFSRDGWSHPGPALFYLLVLPFRLTGSHSNGLLIGAALINAGAIGGMVVLARRRGGTPFAMLVALGSLILVSGLGLEFVWDPWNPFVTVLPFGVVVLAAWCVTCGDAWCLPVVAGVGSFCAQTHVGYLPLVVVLGGISVGALAVAARKARQRGEQLVRFQRAPVLVTVVILAVFWVPPLVQQLTTTPGNLQTIVHYFRTPNATHSLRDGYHVVAAQFAWNPDWLVGGRKANPFSGEPQGLLAASFPIWWLALAAALTLVCVKGPRSARRFGIVLTITIAASVVAIARTIGPLYEYRVRFVWVLGMFTAAFALWALWTAMSYRAWFPARSLTALALISTIGLSAYNVVVSMDTDPPDPQQGHVASVLAHQLDHHLVDRPGVVVVTANGFAAGVFMTGIMVDLERHAIPLVVPDGLDNRLGFGAHRMLVDQPIREEIQVVVNGDIEKTAANRCAHEIAYWGHSSRHDRARAQAEVERIKRAIATGRLGPQSGMRHLSTLSPDLSAVAVFQIPMTRSAPSDRNRRQQVGPC